MKFKDVAKLSKEEQDKQVAQAKLALIKLQSQVTTGTPPKSPGQIKAYKKTIARVLTAQRQQKEVKK